MGQTDYLGRSPRWSCLCRSKETRELTSESIEYFMWRHQYLEALRNKAKQERGSVKDAFDRNGHVLPPFSLEAFISWPKSGQPLPTGVERWNYGDPVWVPP